MHLKGQTFENEKKLFMYIWIDKQTHSQTGIFMDGNIHRQTHLETNTFTDRHKHRQALFNGQTNHYQGNNNIRMH